MNAWDAYRDRMSVRGLSRRDTHLNREIQSIQSHLPDSMSYTSAVIFDSDHCWNIDKENLEFGVKKDVIFINSDNLNEKMVMAMPGEEIENGSLLFWMDQYWLVVEQDANNTIYRRNKVLQCNYLLKWIDKNHRIYEQWCAIEDGTKYLTGEYDDRDFIVTRGDSRIAITIARNSHTAVLGRRDRFLIDDEASERKLAYTLSKPLKFSGVYGKHGVMKFVLQEVNATDDDNEELGIADYYKHFLHETDRFGDPIIREDNTVLPDDPRDGKTERGKWV